MSQPRQSIAILSAGIALAALSGLILIAARSADGAADGKARSALVARGEYLITTHLCNDCHTPWKMGPKGPEPDMSRMLSGHPEDLVVDKAPALDGPWGWAGAQSMTAFAGPWGISYTANLTPDVNTGLGIWTEEMFINALRTGKHMGQAGSRDILPPMPWPWIGKMSDADLKACWAYLRSIPAITNHVPAPKGPATPSPR